VTRGGHRDRETCLAIPSLKWQTLSSSSCGAVPLVRVVALGLVRFIILLFALVVASDARRRMHGVEGWGRHLRCGPRAAAQEMLRAHPPVEPASPSAPHDDEPSGLAGSGDHPRTQDGVEDIGQSPCRTSFSFERNVAQLGRPVSSVASGGHVMRASACLSAWRDTGAQDPPTASACAHSTAGR
jgi:hypothetical protein